MRKVWIATSVVLCVSLGACGLEWPEVDQVAQAKMIGLSKTKIRACLGPPDWRKPVGSTEIWSYGSGTTQTEGEGFATFGNPRHPHCRINVVMTNGVVSQVNYAGLAGDSLDLGERCVFPAAACAGP
jgi:hypothetical protein